MIQALLLTANLLLADDAAMASCPLHAQHMAEAAANANAGDAHADGNHAAEVDHRHDSFGMAHDAAHHRFTATDDGGTIELRANDAADAKTIAAIQKHLQSIRGEFAKNDFSKPQFVHGRMPDGVDTMQRLHASIMYHYEPLPDGGRVHLMTKNAEAIEAIHAFLKFQAVEHRAGDTAAQ
ncbi:MAG: hypothetical protein JO197_02925 [Acidobacteria bacterium]|nr:hypothetical protein [Acidobacteriota bacterium]MBV9476665.1 hypothetical protein [Acidobacteriota bacterium]